MLHTASGATPREAQQWQAACTWQCLFASGKDSQDYSVTGITLRKLKVRVRERSSYCAAVEEHLPAIVGFNVVGSVAALSETYQINGQNIRNRGGDKV